MKNWTLLLLMLAACSGGTAGDSNHHHDDDGDTDLTDEDIGAGDTDDQGDTDDGGDGDQPLDIEVEPASGSLITSTRAITVTFPRQMDPATLSVGGSMASYESAWSQAFVPNDRVVLTPAFSSWSVGFSLESTIGAQDLDGDLLQTQVVYDVDGAAPNLVLDPAGGSTIAPDQVITFHLSESIDPASLSVSGPLAASADVTVATTNHDDDTVVATPETTWPLGDDLTLQLQLTDLAGNAGTYSATYDVAVGAPSFEVVPENGTYLDPPLMIVISFFLSIFT
jgi:hypothetical protein